jgi:DNA-binding transcriptional MerR regulator
LRGKRLGLTLQESRDIIAMYDPARGNIEQLEKLITTYRQKREQLQLQLQDLRGMIDDLQAAENKCLQALAQQPANDSITNPIANRAAASTGEPTP